MKKILFLLLPILFLAASCEEVVEVDLDTAAPRLVIDASINWVKGTPGNEQTVKLTTTTGYYNPQIPVVTGATVFITNSTGTVFDFTEEPNTGNYKCTNFVPVVGGSYTLTVITGGQTYRATETLYPTPQIDGILQDNEGGFLNEDVEVRFYYPDNGATDNWYMYRFDAPVIPYPDYDVIEDKFFQGNQMFGIFSHENLAPGHDLRIRLYGISQRYYNYMTILIAMAEGGAGSGPFQSPPTTLRSNMINQTNEDNYALGYFRLGEVEDVTYTIE